MRDTNIRQEIAMSSRTPSKRRLYPSAFDSDFYMLSSLRKSLERAIVRYVDKGSLIFDYGCGDAPYRTLFQHSKYIAGDLMGNPQADIIIAPDGRVPYEDGKFDVILSS